jgi:hypothetical protein
VGWCGGLHVDGDRWQVGATYLDVVAVSSPRSGLFVPKGSQAKRAHCPPTEEYPWSLLCPLHPSPHNAMQLWIHRTLFHIVIAGSHLTQCVPPRARDCLVPGELDTSPRQRDGFKLPADAAYLHAFTPVSVTLSFSLPFPTTSTAVPWSPLQPSFLRKYYYSSSLSSPSQHRTYLL